MTSAILNNYSQSPRKVRLVADLIKGKSVVKATEQLAFLPKKAAGPFKKLLASAVASAKAAGEKPEDMKIKSIVVEGAGMNKRYMPRAFGRASLIRKRKSRVFLTLS